MARMAFNGGAAKCVLASGIDASVTSIALTGDTSGWPTGSGGRHFEVALERGTDRLEKIECSALSANVLTVVTRGYDSSSAQAHSAGTAAEHGFSAAVLNDLSGHVYDGTRDDHSQYLLRDGSEPFTGLTDLAAAPSSVGTANTEGTALTLARSDHIHRHGTGSINDATSFAAGVIDAAALGAGAVTAAKLAAGAALSNLGGTDTNFLTPPSCRVYNSASQNHASSGNYVSVTFDSEHKDTDTMHSTSSNTSRITFNTAGFYLVGGCVQFAGNATGIRALQIHLNGASGIVDTKTLTVGAGAFTTLSVTTGYQFAVNDYIELQAFQDSGGTLAMSGTDPLAPEFWAVRVGP